MDKKSRVLEESSALVNEILKQKETAKRVIKELKELDFEEDLKKRTYKPIITSKPIYVRGMMEGLRGIKEKRLETYEELENFYLAVTKTLKSIQSVQLKQGRYMSFAFRKEMMKLGTSLNRIIDKTGELENKITGIKKEIQESEETLSLMDQLKEKLRELEDGRLHSERQKEFFKTLSEKIDSINNQINDIEGSDEYAAYLGMEKELDDLESKQKSIEDSVYSLVSSLLRPMRKYERFLETTGGQEEKKIVGKVKEYLKSPKDAFSAEGRGEMFLEKILSGMKEAIKRGEISLDSREQDKALARLNQIKRGYLKNKMTEIEGFKKKGESLRREISSSGIRKRRDELLKMKANYVKERETAIAKPPKTSLAGIDFKDLKTELEDRLSKLLGRTVALDSQELETVN
jgi:hypothetical protein